MKERGGRKRKDGKVKKGEAERDKVPYQHFFFTHPAECSLPILLYKCTKGGNVKLKAHTHTHTMLTVYDQSLLHFVCCVNIKSLKSRPRHNRGRKCKTEPLIWQRGRRVRDTGKAKYRRDLPEGMPRVQSAP